MAKLIHAMVRVLDEDRSKRFYRDALGLNREERLAFDGFTLVYLRNDDADFEIELTINHDRTEPYTHGDGYGHLAVAVDDLDSEHRRMTALGIEATPIKEFMRNDDLLARFFFVKDPDGYKVEVLQRHGRYR
ncbi:MAG TPA: VOC family protein [Stellaceae bacterium]|jgi:lactoylglutathione lyase